MREKRMKAVSALKHSPPRGCARSARVGECWWGRPPGRHPQCAGIVPQRILCQVSTLTPPFVSVPGAQGKHEEADLVYLRAMGILERAFGADDPRLATCVGGRAVALRAQVMDAPSPERCLPRVSCEVVFRETTSLCILTLRTVGCFRDG